MGPLEAAAQYVDPATNDTPEQVLENATFALAVQIAAEPVRRPVIPWSPVLRQYCDSVRVELNSSLSECTRGRAEACAQIGCYQCDIIQEGGHVRRRLVALRQVQVCDGRLNSSLAYDSSECL